MHTIDTKDQNECFDCSRTTYHDQYLIVYEFCTPSFRDHDVAIREFNLLLKDLEAVGLHTEVRAGYDQSLLIFTKAPKELLGSTIYHSRVKDWLYGITKKHLGGNRDSAANGTFEAEDLLSMFHLVNWQKELVGARITPGIGKWKNVTSIFPLHNDRTNQQLLIHLSKRLFLKIEDLDKVRDLSRPQ
ncbi:hypothetical protein BCR34DRAFT_573600 [Clohesyomyces aquaticus]|uniref:Anoctamin alpha-beta plait domain-containing protein n=1 Tax=Clohesyomyces aquaticus TaxID=1231657 RepID=A0A1Y1YZ66_9PLEO|nr:hypothetical protein BCR34DRAFT_573600 [Clohesyomyces aquaticus]